MQQTISLLRNAIAAGQQRRAEILSDITRDSCELLPLLFAELFREQPKLELIAWSQFDGEYNDEGPYPGVFAQAVVYGGDVYDEYARSGNLDATTAAALLQKANQFLAAVPEEAAFELFGTYNWVVATRKGIVCPDHCDLYDYDIDWKEILSQQLKA